MAQTLIVFSSKRGTTRSSAHMLADRLSGGADLYNLGTDDVVTLEGYDAIVVGGSVYMGKISKTLQQFVADNEGALLKVGVLALFLCGMEEGAGMQAQLEKNFSQALRDKAIATTCFGGEFLFSQMGRFTRFLMRLAMSREDVHHINEQAIEALATAINSALL